MAEQKNIRVEVGHSDGVGGHTTSVFTSPGFSAISDLVVDVKLYVTDTIAAYKREQYKIEQDKLKPKDREPAETPEQHAEIEARHRVPWSNDLLDWIECDKADGQKLAKAFGVPDARPTDET